MSQELTPQNLDQSEIDRLLAQAAEEQKPRVLLLRANGERAADNDELHAETYDFRNPAFLSELELRRLRILQEDFIRYLAARLSLFLRMEIGLKMAKLTTLSYSKFTEALPNPTHLCLFKAEPLVGVGIIDVNPRLALTMADRLLGGRGHSVKSERYLTEIEIALLEDVILIILEEWCNQWKGEQELHPLLIGHENNGRFLQTSPKDAVVLALSIEASFGDCSEQIQIGVPYYTIEPLVRSMQARRQRDSAVSQLEKRSAWQPGYSQIDVPVRADWEAFELSLREITSLRAGDIIELPARLIEQTRVLVNGTPLFQGTAGLDTGRIAVQLTARIAASPTLNQKSDGRKIA
ncbi:MAG TPA: FliM/FliN family flagellar motor switch protein [Opitutus sp.]|nr:FliM/FliN family flagellar motor switch protein [Opitutus sp.]